MTLDLDDGSLGFPACAVDLLFGFSMSFLVGRMLSFQSISNERAVDSKVQCFAVEIPFRRSKTPSRRECVWFLWFVEIMQIIGVKI